jgi:acrylyl-CoA reductase (NADPH)
MDTFKAFRAHPDGGRIETLSLEDIDAGEVVVRAAYSGVNFKDALAVTGKGKILRRQPMVPGIDVSGEIASSEDPRFQPGQKVVITGCGLGENHDGGYAELVRVPADWVVPLPPGLDLWEAMALGTAGFTAAMALERMERNGTTPQSGPILINGASGGVGSLAIDMFAKAGYSVTALTAKRDQIDRLKALGAQEVLLSDELDMGRRPLERALWGGAVDNIGGEVLTWLTRTVRPWCNIASVGLAGSIELNTTVMPFILRGVSLLGINSVECPYEMRQRLWERLADELKPRYLDSTVRAEIGLDALGSTCDALLARRISGRTLVRLLPDATL